jgi:hypothetical protein
MCSTEGPSIVDQELVQTVEAVLSELNWTLAGSDEIFGGTLLLNPLHRSPVNAAARRRSRQAQQPPRSRVELPAFAGGG